MRAPLQKYGRLKTIIRTIGNTIGTVFSMSLVSTATLLSVPAAAQTSATTGKPAGGTGPRAEVIHWWTAGGESSAVKSLAESYRAAGGVWIDNAVALGEQARAVALNRMVGGNPPTAAQFNTTNQFKDI